MSSSAQHFDILFKALNLRKGHNRRTRTVLVLGSRAGGLFRSEEFYETLKLFGDPSFSSLPRIKQFSECYRLLTRRKNGPGFSATDIDTILTSALKEIDMADADICLAELVRSGLFGIIVTTSMDNILEDSLKYAGMKEMHDFDVFRLHDGLEKDKLRFEKNVSCSIIKVFGELTTQEYVIRRSGYLNRNPSIKEMLEGFLEQDVIVIGLDPVWDEEIYQAFRPQGNSFWFINEEALNEDTTLFHIEESRNPRYFISEESSYQYFVQKMYETFFGAMSTTIQKDYLANGSVLRELHRLRYEIRKLQEEIRSLHKSS